MGFASLVELTTDGDWAEATLAARALSSKIPFLDLVVMGWALVVVGWGSCKGVWVISIGLDEGDWVKGGDWGETFVGAIVCVIIAELGVLD